MLTFVFVVLILFLIPGPAVLLTISQTVKGGKRTGIMTGVGIAVGDLIHTLAAVFGLSAILMTSALAFQVVKYLGAAYLIYLGISALLEKTKGHTKSSEKEAKPLLSFRQAILIELLNPKTALFFLAFLPQFVHHDGGASVVIQLLILGLTFVLMSILYTSLLVIVSSSIGSRLSLKNSKLSRWQGKIVGLIYICLGLKLALQMQK